MLGYHYSYAVGAALYGAAWIVLYVSNEKFRNQMLLGSLLSAPFALMGFLFIPLYWHPPSLFDLDQNFGISIEDVVWSAVVGGIATVTGEALFRDELDPTRQPGRRNVLVPVGVTVFVFAFLELLHRESAMNNLLAGFTSGALVIAFARRDLIPYMFRSAAAFSVLYFLLFYSLTLIYPNFVPGFYNLKNMAGIYVFGVPIEELEFAFTGGAMWSALYAYSRGHAFARRVLLPQSA
jgi:hypothetical protein